MSGYIVRDLPNLVPTSSGATLTNAIGGLDDASVIVIYVNSTRSTSASVQISPNDPFSTGFSNNSTAFFTTALVSTVMATGQAYTIEVVGFRGLRLAISSGDTGTASAFVTKQILL